MDLRILIIIFIILEASVWSGASAQSNENDPLTELISGVLGTTSNAKSDSVIIDWGDDPYIYQHFDTHSQDQENNIMDILSFLADDVDSGMASNSSKKVTSSMVLDYMANVYKDHDFYQTGYWDAPEDFSHIIRNIPLPEYNTSDFFRPVGGRVTSSYGYRASFRRMHKGIDLALNIGDTVRAALPGVVAKTGYDPYGYGHYVAVVHNNGMETRYAHLQSIISSPGETLQAGQPLGLGGNTGNSTGPHLHFEVRYNGQAVNPASVFDFVPIPSKQMAHLKE